MVRQRSTGLQQTEWDILATLWELDSASAGEVTKAIQTRHSWAYSTVKTLLKRMVNKDLVRARLKSDVWRFSAVYSRLELQQRQWRHFVDVAFDGSVQLAKQFVLSMERSGATGRRKTANKAKVQKPG
jgi:BlaI family penicillinase repressor